METVIDIAVVQQLVILGKQVFQSNSLHGHATLEWQWFDFGNFTSRLFLNGYAGQRTPHVQDHLLSVDSTGVQAAKLAASYISYKNNQVRL